MSFPASIEWGPLLDPGHSAESASGATDCCGFADKLAEALAPVEVFEEFKIVGIFSFESDKTLVVETVGPG